MCTERYHQSDFGWLSLRFENNYLLHVSWVIAPQEPLIDPSLSTYLDALLLGIPISCSWLYELIGTLFQQRVWAAIQQIPFRHVRTYREIAIQIGSPKVAQAVGQACLRNPVPLVMPCQRVIRGADVSGGYCGYPISTRKTRLLQHEKGLLESR